MHLLRDSPAGRGPEAGRGAGGSPAAGAAWPTSALLAQALRHGPPARKTRRMASVAAEAGGELIRAGDMVVCDIEAAGQDPAAGRPGAPDYGSAGPPGLAFGAGLRPCPAPGHALALASGVIDAVRERCVLPPGPPVTWEASATRVPERLDVVLR